MPAPHKASLANGEDGCPAAPLSALYRRVACRILPLLFLCYVVAYIDRVNVGFAKLQMTGDLRFSESVYGLGAGIFFLGYFLFEVPSNLLLHRIGARVWICRIMVTWGIVSGCTALVRTPGEFYLVRLLLGIAESGFFPGMVLYLTYWFPSHRRAAMVAALMAANPVSGILGGPASGAILRELSGRAAVAGWQWLFILEAVPAIVLGFAVLVWLEDRVCGANWLSDAEKSAITAEIESETAHKTHHTTVSVFRSSRVWLMAAIWFGIEMGSYAIGFWLPTVLREAGVRDSFDIGLLQMLPYGAGLIAMILFCRHSDRTRERRLHVVAPCTLAAVGFVLCARAGGHTSVAMAGLTLAVAGVVTALPMFWALPTSFLGGTAAAAGIALVNCVGNLGGFFSPTMIGLLKDHTGTLNSGLILVAGCMVISSLLIVTLIPAELVNV